jgi:3-polyprenyl-4-hydroxybenzoate decarboxylase
VKGVTVDLDVPADAEIVIEGLIDTSLFEPEAPFGESNGYLALEAFNMPMQVTAITHKKKPVFCAIISQVTPSESSLIKRVAYEPLYLSHLRDQLNIKGVKRVVLHEPLTNLRPVIMIQLSRGTPRTEVWRALHGASKFLANCGKICIAVSEDIEPSNCDALFWSMAYRCNPIEDVQITPYHGGMQGNRRATDSAMLIDATQKRDMAPLALPTQEFMENSRKIWDELGLPPVTARPPWYGYSLGNWNETWERFAQRATQSEWEMNGRETLARTRPGLEPETPVWRVEKPEDKKA